MYLYSSRISYKYEFHELISVGSLGRNRTTEKVSDVHVRNCTFTGTTNGARIKTVEVSVTNKVKYMFILYHVKIWILVLLFFAGWIRLCKTDYF